MKEQPPSHVMTYGEKRIILHLVKSGKLVCFWTFFFLFCSFENELLATIASKVVLLYSAFCVRLDNKCCFLEIHFYQIRLD
jgi:hypothetical protein